MKEILFPYGRKALNGRINEENLLGIMESKLSQVSPAMEQSQIVKDSLSSPIGTKRLGEMAKGKKNVVIISSDHTRPVPSKIIMPCILKELRSYEPSCNITILIATGCHRKTTTEELIERYGKEIVDTVPIVVHDCDDPECVDMGTLPSGNRFFLNKTAAQADLLVAEGFIEPHFFAGFSGGRKAVLPGVCARQTVMYNHSAGFIAHGNSRTGVLKDNPIHLDMCQAAEKANLAFIVNVVLNTKKEIIGCFSGDSFAAHQKGVDYIRSLCACKKQLADVVITTNGGYPLDQNVYQSFKGMSTAEACCKEGGVIIMLSKCNDGHGAQSFYEMLKKEPDNQKLLDAIVKRSPESTVADQWQTQIFLRILTKFKVILVSDCDDEMIRDMHLIPAKDLDSAISKALDIAGRDAKILAIPDGVSTLIEE
ncbi:MAG: nickel-dependent lactate racemase [Ruminococcaceae bacterium]|nr:nickel-dependent lactate racemase [Oscillospiraceae bacterium]